MIISSAAQGSIRIRPMALVTVAFGSLLELTLVSPPLAMLDPAWEQLDEGEGEDLGVPVQAALW